MLAMTLALLLQAGATGARPPPSATDLPQWSRAPSAAEMTAAYPPGPRAENLAGSGVMDCTVGAAGELTACEVVSETVAGQGFGAAAISLASKFQLPLKSPSGAAMAGRTVRVPIRWLNPPKRKLPEISMLDENGRTGTVAFNCRVNGTGSYDNCVVVEARPAASTLFGVTGEVVLRQKPPANLSSGDRVLIVVQVRAE
jgi:hypothetical protein